MKNAKDLGKDPIRTLFFSYYIPGLIGMASMISHLMINGIILGHQLGKEALAAIAIFTPVNLVFMATVLVLMIGGGILFSKSKGAGQPESALKIFQFTTTLTLILGVISMLVAIFCNHILTGFLIKNESQKITEYTSKLLFWNLLFMPLLLLRIVWGNFLINDNAPAVSKNASLITAILNVALDVLLVIVFPFGIAGACIATAISFFAGVIYIFSYLRKGHGIINFRDFHFRLQLAEWKDFLKAGLPLFISEVSFSIGLFLINKSLATYGAFALSAFGIINFFNNIFLRFFITAMITVQPIMAFNFGAKQITRVQETLKFGIVFTVVLGIIFYSLSFFFSGQLIGIVSGNEPPAFREVGERALLLSFLLYVVAGPNYILAMYLQVIGKSALAILINASKGLIFLWLFLLVLPQFLELKLDGVWMTRPAAELVTLIMVGVIVFYGRRKYVGISGSAPHVIKD